MADNPNDTLAKIGRIIESGNLKDFIGMKEDEFFDAKQKNPYDLTSEGGRIELAKDVSAFANSGGGYIIIGLSTISLETIRAEEVNNLDVLCRSDFKTEQYKGIIKEYIYPQIDNIRVDYVPDKNNTVSGVGVIYVPPQNDAKKFFLMKKISDDSKIKQIIFGIALRQGSSCDALTIDQIYNKLQNGKSPIAQRLTIIEKLQDAMRKELEKIGTSQAELMQNMISGLQRTNEPESLQIQGATDDILRKRIQEIKEG